MIIQAKDLDFLLSLARNACENVLKYRNAGLDVRFKNNDEHDPLTLADETTDALIRNAIAGYFPEDQILSEENDSIPTDYRGRVWMIDPLDGTKEFLSDGGRFSVMIGLCVGGNPVLGIVAHPLTGDIYYAIIDHGAHLLRNGRRIRLIARKSKHLHSSTLLVSRKSGEPRQSEAFLRELPFKAFQEDASFGLRAALIAEGVADAFVGTNKRASKWDVCAPQVILEESGSALLLLDGKKIDYTQQSTKIGKSFLGTTASLREELIERLQGLPEN